MFSWFSGLFAPKQMQYHLRSDVHCHLLPGLDDGAKTEELSETLLADFANIGVQRIAFTPHVAFPRMPNSHQTILDRFQKTLQRVQQLQIPLQRQRKAPDPDHPVSLPLPGPAGRFQIQIHCTTGAGKGKVPLFRRPGRGTGEASPGQPDKM